MIENKVSLTQLELALPFPVKAELIKIIDEISCKEANDLLLADKAFQRMVHEAFDAQVESANIAHKTAVSQRSKYLNPLLEAEKIIKTKISRWVIEQERLRHEAEDRIMRATKKAQEKAEKLLGDAEEAEKTGNKLDAQKLIEKATQVMDLPFFEQPKKVKLEETYTVSELKWRIIDEGLIPREYLCVDRAKIAAAFAVQRERLRIAGIEIYEETNIRTRLR